MCLRHAGAVRDLPYNLAVQLGRVCRGRVQTLLSQEGGLAEDEFDDGGCIV